MTKRVTGMSPLDKNHLPRWNLFSRGLRTRYAWTTPGSWKCNIQLTHSALKCFLERFSKLINLILNCVIKAETKEDVLT